MLFIPTLLLVKCPNCNHSNAVSAEEFDYRGCCIVHCDFEEGGCKGSFVVSAEVEVKTKVINYFEKK